MKRLRTTQDLYGDVFRRLDVIHDGVRKFRVEVARAKEVFAKPVGGLCCIPPTTALPEFDEEGGPDVDHTCRSRTPQPLVEAGREEFRLALVALRSITL